MFVAGTSGYIREYLVTSQPDSLQKAYTQARLRASAQESPSYYKTNASNDEFNTTKIHNTQIKETTPNTK